MQKTKSLARCSSQGQQDPNNNNNIQQSRNNASKHNSKNISTGVLAKRKKVSQATLVKKRLQNQQALYSH